MTHPAQHHVDAAKKRQQAWVEGRVRGVRSDRPGKAGALKGGASEDRETQSDTLPLVPNLRNAKFPPPDTVAGAEAQRARGGSVRRADGGETEAAPGSWLSNALGMGGVQKALRDAAKRPGDASDKPPPPPPKARGGASSEGGAAKFVVDDTSARDMGDLTPKRDKPSDRFTSDSENDPDRARGGGTSRTPSGGVSAVARREAAANGEAMSGGRFPIRDKSDLVNAKHAYGRASDKPAVRRWINGRAKDLGEPPLGG